MPLTFLSLPAQCNRETDRLLIDNDKVPSGQALLRLAEAAKKNGVRYVTGDAGQIKELWYDSRGTCKGAISADGQLHEADIVVVAAGAGLPALVEGANTDVVAQTSAICVIQLEPHEVDRYRNFPVVDDFEQGKLVRRARSSRCPFDLPCMPRPSLAWVQG